jgi:MFS family permease
MNSKHSHPSVEAMANASNAVVDEESPLLAHTQAKSIPNQQSHDTQTAPTDVELSTRYLAIVFGSVFIGVFLAALDTTIVATLSVPISDCFGSLNLVSWLGSSYLIANAACQPLSGRLTDIFSRRSGLIVCNILFGIGTLTCGLATSKWVLLSGRVVAGMGGGGLNAITAFLASDFVPLRKRGVIQGFVHICYGVGAGLGGLFGGWVNDLWGWRAAFLSRVPLIVLSTILVFFTLRNTPSKQNDDSKSKLSRVDFLGAFTLSLSLVMLLLGLNSGGNVVPWNHPLVLVSTSLSLVAAVSLTFIETKWAEEPIIPMHLLLDRSVLAACMMNCLVTMTLLMATFYVPIFFQVNGLSTSASGVRLLPQSIGTSVSSLACGFIVKRTGKYRTLGLVVIASSAFGFIGLSTMTIETSTILILVYVLLVGVGYGGMLSISLIATVAAVSPDEQAVAISAIYAFRSTGSTVGVTIASVVYQNLLQQGLRQRFGTEKGSGEEIERILKSLDELKHLPGGWSKGVFDAFAVALRGVFLTGLGLVVLGLVATSLLREHRLYNNLSRADHD